MLTEEILKTIKINAFLSVKNPDYEAFLRRVFRWYSKTFYTPLHQVEELPVFQVLTAYYEEIYEKMDEGELKQEKIRLTMTTQEWSAKLIAEEQEDLAFIEAVQSKKRIEDIKTKGEGQVLTKKEQQEGFELSFEDVPI